MSNAVTTTAGNKGVEKKGLSVKFLMESDAYKKRLQQMLGDRAPQFIASVVQLTQGSWQLSKCEPNSVIAACITAAALDLPVDKNLGFAHIVPYKDKAQFQIGYKGFVQLGMRTGQYKLLNVTEVYDGELIKFDRVRAEVIIDQDKRKPKAKVIGYVAFMQLTNGFEHSEYWTIEMVEAHALRYSQAYKGDKETPWKTNFDGMAKKTVLKALLSHWGPMSVQMNKALVEDQGTHTDIDSEVMYPDNEQAQAPEFAPVGEGEEIKQLASAPVPSEPSAQTNTTNPSTPKRVVNLAKPYDELGRLMNEDQITEPQLVNFAKDNADPAGKPLCGPKVKEIMQFTQANAAYILSKWDEFLPLIKKASTED